MKNTLYPDFGNPLEDASVLRNAVQFSTTFRAFSAQSILQQPLGVDKRTMAFLVLKAFEEFMTSTEDLLGWLFTLKEWQPGTAEFSIVRLLDNIQIVPKQEADAVALLSRLDEQEFRQLIHVPDRRALLASGMSVELVDTIDTSIGPKLEGWRKIARIRLEGERGRVRAFNKLKHHMLAFYSPLQKDEIFIPSDIRLDRAQNIVKLKSANIEVSANMVRQFATDARMAQAVLWDTLALILMTRFNEKHDPPSWVISAYRAA